MLPENLTYRLSCYARVTMLLLALVFTLSAPGCGGDSGPAPTCSEAMGSFYSNNCTFFSEGQPVPLSDAILGCNQFVVAASSAGGSCPGRLNDLLRCLYGVSNYSDCETCNDELGIFDACTK